MFRPSSASSTIRRAIAISLIENIQREELNPADEARALKRLIEEFSLTHEQVAHAIGRSRAMVTNLLRLLDLPGEVTTMIDSRVISMGHARALLGLEDDGERVRVAQLIATRQWSVRGDRVAGSQGPCRHDQSVHPRGRRC